MIALLLLAAIVLFVLAAFGVPARVGLGWIGLALVTLAYALATGRVPT